MPLIVITNLDETSLKRTAGERATLRGIPDAILLDPRDTDVARWLARNPREKAVFVAHHPQHASDKCEGDRRLPKEEEEWRAGVRSELTRLAAGADSAPYEDALQRLTGGRIEFVVKCLRHEIPASTPPPGNASFLFARLADLAAVPKEDGERWKIALLKVFDEFTDDVEARHVRRQEILALWHTSVANLCVLELELSALADLDPSAAAEYLQELVSDPAYGEFTGIEAQVGKGLDRLESLELLEAPADLRAIRLTLQALQDAKNRYNAHNELSLEDVKTVTRLEPAYTKSVRQVSELFRQAVAIASQRAAAGAAP